MNSDKVTTMVNRATILLSDDPVFELGEVDSS